MAETSSRIDWVDYCKGICIILVVICIRPSGSKRRLARPPGSGLIEWARPFRMPDFFLISGLFLSRRIAQPWPTYSTQGLPLCLFLCALDDDPICPKAPSLRDTGSPSEIWRPSLGPRRSLCHPVVHLPLAVFFLVVKVLHWAPPAASSWRAPFSKPHRGNRLYSARRIRRTLRLFLFGLCLASESLPLPAKPNRTSRSTRGGVDRLGCPERMAGHGRSCDITRRQPCPWLRRLGSSNHRGGSPSARLVGADLRYSGANSIVIYLAFVLFMAPSRILLIKSGLITRSWPRGAGCNGRKRCRPADPLQHHTPHTPAFPVHPAGDVPSQALAKDSIAKRSRPVARSRRLWHNGAMLNSLKSRAVKPGDHVYLDRRVRIHLPGLSCFAAAHPQERWSADWRSARLLCDASQAFARIAGRREADPSCRDLRQIRSHVPQRIVRRLQGQSSPSALRSHPAIRHYPPGGARLQRAMHRAGGL